MDRKNEWSPEAVWRAYERGQDYKRSIGLYERVKKNEDFVQGRQWEGLRVNTLDPLIFNVLRRCVNLFVAMMVSDDVAVSAAPFARDAQSEQVERVLEQAFESAMERSRVKDLDRWALRNACVDGDGCFYIYFDPDLATGQAARGDIQVECIDNTNVYFGNIASDEVGRQPYIILAMRRDVDEVKSEALKNRRPAYDVNAIRPDGEGENMVPYEKDKRVTVLLHMRKVPGGVAFQKTTRQATVMKEKILPHSRYPVAFMSWDRVKNSCHGVSPVTEAIPNQIAINKLYSMYIQCIKQVAFPKIIYDMTRFPNGYSSEIGKAVGMRGNPNQAVLSAFKAPDISSQVLQVLQRMMSDTMELMGASDALLGNVTPTNTSAIVAVQKATAAPLELVKLEFYRFIEDWARSFLDLMGAHYGVRQFTVTDEEGNEQQVSFDFSALRGGDMKMKVEVGEASYWSETVQTVTNDRLVETGLIADPLLYLQNVPDQHMKGKRGLMRALKKRQKEEQHEQGKESV